MSVRGGANMVSGSGEGMFKMLKLLTHDIYFRKKMILEMLCEKKKF